MACFGSSSPAASSALPSPGTHFIQGRAIGVSGNIRTSRERLAQELRCCKCLTELPTHLAPRRSDTVSVYGHTMIANLNGISTLLEAAKISEEQTHYVTSFVFLLHGNWAAGTRLPHCCPHEHASPKRRSSSHIGTARAAHAIAAARTSNHSHESAPIAGAGPRQRAIDQRHHTA